MKNIKIIIIAMLVLFTTGCSQTNFGTKLKVNPNGYVIEYYPYNAPSKTFYCKQFYSVSSSDGWYFTDEQNKKITWISGPSYIREATLEESQKMSK